MYALDELRRQVAELRRLVHLLWIIGPVAEIDAARRRVRVAYGDPAADPRPTTGWIPWSSERAAGPGDGESEWRPPAVGEVVMVACPEGNAALGVVVRSLPTLAAAPPSADLAVRAWRGADGAEISYDADAHALTAVLPAGGTAALTAPGGVTVTGDLTVTGDVLGGSVADGDGNLGEIRTIYNRHVHTVPPCRRAAGIPRRENDMTRPRLGAVVAAVAYGWMAVGLVGIAGLLRSCAAPVLAILSQSWLFE